jgi:hypothetical protein
MQDSGASRREIAELRLKLFWLFENRIGTCTGIVGWAKRSVPTNISRQK